MKKILLISTLFCLSFKTCSMNPKVQNIFMHGLRGSCNGAIASVALGAASAFVGVIGIMCCDNPNQELPFPVKAAFFVASSIDEGPQWILKATGLNKDDGAFKQTPFVVKGMFLGAIAGGAIGLSKGVYKNCIGTGGCKKVMQACARAIK